MTGAATGAVNSIDDLAKFPFTTKAELRDLYPMGLLAVPLGETVRVHALSGTGVAAECFEAKGALHVFDDHFWPEIVDPTTGQPADHGELALRHDQGSGAGLALSDRRSHPLGRW